MYTTFETEPPTDPDHLWEMIEFNFEHARHILEDYPVETREEAISGHFRTSNSTRTPINVLAYRDKDMGYDLRDYCIELGRATLPVVEAMIKARQLTPAFFQSWGVLQFCHGCLVTYVFAETDDFSRQRSGNKTGRERSKALQRKWIAHIVIPLMRKGMTRESAEAEVVKCVRAALQDDKLRGDFSRGWFEDIVDGSDELKSTYDYKHLWPKAMLRLINEPINDIPPIPKSHDAA